MSETSRARVSVVKGVLLESYRSYSSKDLEIVKGMIDRSIELLGVDRSRFRGLNTVVVKPNIVEIPYSLTYGSVITDPRVLEAMVQLLRDYGVKRVVVAEGKSVNMRYEDIDPEDVFEKTGLKEVIVRSGGEIMGWHEESYVEIENPQGEILSRVRVPRSVLEAEMFISVPKLKTHCQTEITVGIKSMQGVYNVSDKVMLHNESFPWKMIDMLRVLRPNLSIVDGLIAGEGYGPIYSEPVKMDLIISSEDVVAVDAVSSYIMGIDPMEVPMIRLGHSEGIGIGDLSLIEIRGEDIDRIRRVFKRSSVMWNPIGACRNVRIYAGGACRFCLAQIGAAITRLKFEGLLDRFREDVQVLVGYNFPLGAKEYRHVYVIGDCAISYLKQMGRLKGVLLEGCPPLPSKQIYEYLLKHVSNAEAVKEK